MMRMKNDKKTVYHASFFIKNRIQIILLFALQYII